MVELKKMRLFQKSVVGIMVFFFGMLVLVTVVAQTKRSGSTGLDMGKVQQLRSRALQAEAP